MKPHAHTDRLSTLVRALIHRTHGQDLIEYAILAAVVTTVGVMALNQIGGRVADYMVNAAQEVNAAAGGEGGGAGDGDGGGGGTGGGGTGGGGTGGGGTGRGGGGGNGGGKK